MRWTIIIIVFIISTVSFGQNYLNDTVSFGSAFCRLQAVCQTDSGYYFSGMRFTNQNTYYSELLLGFVDNNGVFSTIMIDYEPYNNQRYFGSYHDLNRNDRGNFIYLFKNCDTAGCYHRLKEISPSGDIVADVSFDTLVSIAGGTQYIFDFDDIFFLEDSTYALSLNTSAGDLYGTNMYVHVDKDFQVMSFQHFIPEDTNLWQIGAGDVFQDNNGDIIFVLNHLKHTPPNTSDETKIQFIRIDQNNVVVDSDFFSPYLNMGAMFEVSSTPDGFIFTALGEGYQVGNNWNNKYLLYKLDKNFQFLWSARIREDDVNDITEFIAQFQTRIAPDGSYIVAGGFTHPDYASPQSLSVAQLSKFSSEGELLWQRYHHLLPYDSVNTNPAIEITDVINTQDSGFCMVGNHWTLNNNDPDPVKNKGYVVKTNCLGFLGEAHAGATHSALDNFEVRFISTSVQDGGVTWFFGDGDSLRVDEYTDTITHKYQNFGSYEVTMVAHGCHDRNDTLHFEVKPVLHTDPNVVTNGNGYFSIFPNPSISGSEIYVYLNALDPNGGDVILQLFTSNGAMVSEIELFHEEGTYTLNPSLSNGVYFATLYQGDQFIAQKKLVVR